MLLILIYFDRIWSYQYSSISEEEQKIRVKENIRNNLKWFRYTGKLSRDSSKYSEDDRKDNELEKNNKSSDDQT